jgi:hypothetical protein
MQTQNSDRKASDLYSPALVPTIVIVTRDFFGESRSTSKTKHLESYLIDLLSRLKALIID